MKMIVYSTDALVYLLLTGLLVWLYFFRKTPEWRLIIARIKQRPYYLVALILLLIYGAIGLLDSIHFEATPDHFAVRSILDLILSPYDRVSEVTYSAPFATHSAVPEIVTLHNGEFKEVYPKLQYFHLLGTDKIGRDVFYLSVKSIRTGLIIGTVTTLVMLPFALLFGMWAGYFRGWLDDIIQYIYTTLSSVPGVLLIAGAMLALQSKIESEPESRLLILCVVLGVTSWTTLCRLLRGETLKLRSLDFVQSAIALGVTPLKIIRRHIMPNLMHIVIITVALDFSGLVLAEAVLSYVGVGVDPTSFSWGNMINAARLDMARDPIVWWSLSGALFFMFTLVFSANLFSDVLQEAFNPKAN